MLKNLLIKIKRNLIPFLLTGILIAIVPLNHLNGEEIKNKGDAKDNQLSMDENLVNQIYQEGLEESQIYQESSGLKKIEPELGYFNIQNLTLKNDYFQIDYKQNKQQMVYGDLNISSRLFEWSNFGLNMQYSLGYSYNRGNYKATTSSGLQVDDTVTLQWIPLNLNLELDAFYFKIPFLRPTLLFGGGMNWFHQAGTLDGISQEFWIPSYSVGAALNIWENNKKGPWELRGIKMTVISQKGFSRTQKFGGISYLLGVSILI